MSKSLPDGDAKVTSIAPPVECGGGLLGSKSGIAITSIAGKMSMVIPIIFGYFLYGDQLTTMRIVGILIALFAVYLSSSPSENVSEEPKKKNSIQK